MELEILAGRDPQRAVAPPPRDVIVCEIALGRHDAPRDPGADHHHVVLVEAFLPRLLAAVAVVLLVNAVELEDDAVLFAEMDRVFPKFPGDRAT